MNIKIGRMVLGSVSTNCYFVYDEKIREAVVIDPADNGARIVETLKQNNLKPIAILLTHGHFDHIYGVAKLKQLAHIDIYADEAEKELLGDEKSNCSEQFGRICTVTPDHLLKNGECLTLGGMKIQMISTPGHTSGGCCYYIKDAGFLLSGDTLFEGSVGRTDFPTGSMSQLIRSIQERLLCLPDDTKIYPGHGDSTTLAVEKKYNPYIAEN